MSQHELTPDELKTIEIIRAATKDADLEIIRRDGKIVNVREIRMHRDQFERAKLRETRTP